MLSRKPPGGLWVHIAEAVRYPLRVAAGGCSSPGETPHLAWFLCHHCHFTGGSMIRSHSSFKALLKCSLFWNLWKEARLSWKILSLKAKGLSPSFAAAAPVTWSGSETLWASVSTFLVNHTGFLWELKDGSDGHNRPHGKWSKCIWGLKHLLESSMVAIIFLSSLFSPYDGFSLPVSPAPL